MSSVASFLSEKATTTIAQCRLTTKPEETFSNERSTSFTPSRPSAPFARSGRFTASPKPFRASVSRRHFTLATDSGNPGMGTPAASSSSKAPAEAPSSLLLDPRFSLTVHVSTVVLISATFFNRSLFGYHPTLMALSFLLLMPQAILAAINGIGKGRKAALFTHMVLNAASGLAGIAGLYAIWLNKERNSKPHLVTLHAILGAVAFVASSLIATGGVPLLYGLPQALRKATKTVSRAHKLIGMASFLLGTVVCVLGLQTFKPAHPLHKGGKTYTMAALVVFSAVLVLLSALKKLNKTKAK